ncbi:MAG: 2-phosphosulfolactate phosphatase, partial [Ktedonobacteraceae bacterium]
MHIHVYFTPSGIVARETQPGDIFIVIDVIRATTTLAVIFERGASRVFVAGSIEQARAAAQFHPGCFLCGERNVRPLPGFDYGNSPVQFSQLNLTERELILTTTNGTRAFYACPDGTTCLAGSFYNAHAVTAHALQLAQERGSNIALVCSGEFDYFALDDAVCAGYLVQALQQQAESQTANLLLHESAQAAMTLFEAYKPPKLIEYARSAQSVIEAGLPEDVDFCMQTNLSSSIPMVMGSEEETGLLVLE